MKPLAALLLSIITIVWCGGCSGLAVSTDVPVEVYHGTGSGWVVEPLYHVGRLEPGEKRSFTHWRGDTSRFIFTTDDGRYGWARRIGPDYKPIKVRSTGMTPIEPPVEAAIESRIYRGMPFFWLEMGWGPPANTQRDVYDYGGGPTYSFKWNRWYVSTDGQVVTGYSKYD